MSKLLIVFAIFGLAVAAPGLAMAAAHGAKAPDGAGTQGGDGQAKGEAMKERHQALVEARRAALDAFHENRSAIIHTYLASLNETREWFLAERAALVEGCRPEGSQDAANMTDEERQAFAQCIRTGIEPLRDEARSRMQDAREQATSGLRAAAQDAVAKFRAERAAANQKYGEPEESSTSEDDSESA